jgi:hypothetical protein
MNNCSSSSGGGGSGGDADAADATTTTTPPSLKYDILSADFHEAQRISTASHVTSDTALH